MKKKTMKIRPLILLVALLTALSSFALGQHKHMQMMEMMKDSVMMDLLMDHIASNNQMQATMMKKMIYYAVGDTMKMTEMCRAMMVAICCGMFITDVPPPIIHVRWLVMSVQQ